jgi:hypothetical protein
MLRRRRPTYASVVATLALFFALSGTAIAGAHLLITGANVKDGSLTGADLANHSIGFEELSRGAAARLRGATGHAGPAGNDGAPGAAGAAGAPGATGASGAPGTMIQLAGRGTSVDQTLPDDSAFHPIWSMAFHVAANELFIVTGSIGGESTVGCPDGDGSFQQQVTLDGAPYVFSGALSTFSPGAHTLGYEVRGTCSVAGFPVHVPAQEAILIPFAAP